MVLYLSSLVLPRPPDSKSTRMLSSLVSLNSSRLAPALLLRDASPAGSTGRRGRLVPRPPSRLRPARPARLGRRSHPSRQPALPARPAPLVAGRHTARSARHTPRRARRRAPLPSHLSISCGSFALPPCQSTPLRGRLRLTDRASRAAPVSRRMREYPHPSARTRLFYNHNEGQASHTSFYRMYFQQQETDNATRWLTMLPH